MAKTATKLPSGAWRVQVYLGTDSILQENGTVKRIRKYESFTHDDKREAAKMAAEFACNMKQKSKPTNMSIGEAIDRYIASGSKIFSPTTLHGYRCMRNNALSRLCPIKLSDLDRDTVQREFNLISKKYSPKSVHNAHGLLSAMLAIYYPDFSLKTKLPPKKKISLYIPTDEDIKRLLSSVEGSNLEIPVLLAAFGSMRRGEICALESSDIHGNCIEVNKALVKQDRKKGSDDPRWVLKSPKTFSSYRSIEMPTEVIQKLEVCTGKLVDITPDYLSTKFTQTVESLGFPKFRLHDLRHYQASILHALGVPDKYIMERGGWKTDSTLKSVYQHTLSDKSKEFSKIANTHFSELYATRNATRD